MFAVAAVPGSLLIAQFGALTAVIVGLLLAGVAGSLRGAVADIAWLYVTTILMGAGVAFMQPALAVLARAWAPKRIGFATAVYTNGLLVGETLPVALTLPLVLPLVDGSWRASFVVWGLPMIAVAAAMLLAPRAKAMPGAAPRRWWPDWGDSLIWRLGLILSSVNSVSSNANAFIPSYLTNAGRADLVGPALTALNFAQLPASFLLLGVAQRLERRAWPLIVLGIAMLAALAGVATTGADGPSFCGGPRLGRRRSRSD